MGLHISPGGAQWSYGGFMAFRERLAFLEGFDLRTMQGYCRHYRGGEHPDGECPEAVGDWDEMQAQTPLVPLFNHSDCDGYLQPWECEGMLPRLRRILALWETVEGDPIVKYDRDQLRALIDGMEHVVAHDCAMRFH